MSDLPVVAVLVARAGSEDLVRGALTALVAPTRAEEGCLSYELFESLAKPGTFVTIESWRDQSDLAAHLTTPHITQALELAGEHLVVPPDVHPLTAVA